jgi:hypothetical protein
METIYLNATLHCRPRGKVVDLNAYRQQRSLLLDGTVLPEPEPLEEITPELPEQAPPALERFTAWADAIASVALTLGAIFVFTLLL